MASSLIVEICELKEIQKHTNADALELAIVKGWQTVVKKGQFQKGDKIMFIPPDAIIPVEIADIWNIRNYLAGRDRNRVKCVRLRGEMSFGLIMPVPEKGKDWEIGYDCAEHFGITKYEPPIRTTAGDAAPPDSYFFRYTDIENYRNFPDGFEEGELVLATEKIDGTNSRLSISEVIVENGNVDFEWKAGSHNVKRKKPDEDIKKNTYWFPYTLEPVVKMIEHIHQKTGKPVHLFGEIYGAVRGGHKSMHYGKPSALSYVAFDLMIGQEYVDWDMFRNYCNDFGVPTVPLVDVFEFRSDKVKRLSTGKSILASLNHTDHMREGIVVKPVKERHDPKIGRVILKMLNDDYLLLKNRALDKGEAADYKDE